MANFTGRVIGSYSGTGASGTGTSGAFITLTNNQSVYNNVILGTLWIFVSSISTAATITWFLSRDSAGDEKITPSYASTIQTGQTTATDGTIISQINTVLSGRMIGSAPNTIYLHVKTDAGTVTVGECYISAEVGA